MGKEPDWEQIETQLLIKRTKVQDAFAAAEHRSQARRIAEKADVEYGRKWAAALAGGWSRDELKKAGLPEPTAMPARRVSTKRMKSKTTTHPAPTSTERGPAPTPAPEGHHEAVAPGS